MFKNGFCIDNLNWLMWHQTKPNQTKSNQTKPNKTKLLTHHTIEQDYHFTVLYIQYIYIIVMSLSNCQFFKSKLLSKTCWGIDSNDISNCLGAFYAESWGNYVHPTFIFTFCVQLLLRNFLYSIIWNQVFLSNSQILHTVVWF